MQWNIHKTKNAYGVCDPNRTADVIVAQNPHVVSLNEVDHYSGSCAWTFDMGAHIQSLLQSKTGVTWYRKNVVTSGGSNGVGNVVLSRLAPVATGSALLSYDRGIAEMTVNVNGRNVNIYSTHLAHDSAYWRGVQVSEILRWVTNWSDPRIIMGDFNTWPNTSEYYNMASAYQDAWVAGLSAGTAWAYNGTGATRGDSRLDYVFHSKNSVLTLQGIKVVDTRLNGLAASDHDPIVAVYTVQ
jgi:endonuclease/exonuclease/phosphatase family metal-dependent hydrolase